MRVDRAGLRKLATIELSLREEDTSYKGNILASGDDAQDREAEQWVRDQLEAGNQWAWCTVRISASYGELTGTDCVGGCSYLSREDFMKDGTYDDMVHEAIEDLAGQLETFVNEHGLWEHDVTTCFWCLAAP